MTEQQSFDWERAEAERPLMEQWERNRIAQASQWTDEALAQIWFLGRHDEDMWRSLPRYTRTRVVEQYVAERELLKPGQRLKPYEVLYPTESREVTEARWALAHKVANQLSADWSANRPPSIVLYNTTALPQMVSMLLGREIEGIPPRDVEELNKQLDKERKKRK